MKSLLKLTVTVVAISVLIAGSAFGGEKIKMGTEGAYAPFNLVAANGEIKGFDVEIGKAICAELKADCEWSAHDWGGIIPALQSKKFDVMVASMAINAKRKEQVSFSRPYYFNSMRFAARKDLGVKEVTPKALKGMVIGTQSGNVTVKVLKEFFPNNKVKLYPKPNEAFMDLENGRVDLVLESKFVLGEWLAKDGASCEFVGESFLLDGAEGNAIAVRKNDTKLLGKINAALTTIMKNGTYDKIRAKYFKFDIMTKPKSTSELFKK